MKNKNRCYQMPSAVDKAIAAIWTEHTILPQHIQPSVYPIFPLSFTHNQPIRSPAHCPILRTNPLQLFSAHHPKPNTYSSLLPVHHCKPTGNPSPSSLPATLQPSRPSILLQQLCWNSPLLQPTSATSPNYFSSNQIRDSCTNQASISWPSQFWRFPIKPKSKLEDQQPKLILDISKLFLEFPPFLYHRFWYY